MARTIRLPKGFANLINDDWNHIDLEVYDNQIVVEVWNEHDIVGYFRHDQDYGTSVKYVSQTLPLSSEELKDLTVEDLRRDSTLFGRLIKTAKMNAE